MANKVLGMHRLKNKVNRNAFDLSHRHMFTAQVGELLPVFTQWVNPNETFKIGYNGKTRTAALNSDAFTRIRENIQYYFVPFQSLWRFFEQQVNNMTVGDAGQNISKVALNSSTSASLSTSMPYISYVDISKFLDAYLQRLYSAINGYFVQPISPSQGTCKNDSCPPSTLYPPYLQLHPYLHMYLQRYWITQQKRPSQERACQTRYCYPSLLRKNSFDNMATIFPIIVSVKVRKTTL